MLESGFGLGKGSDTHLFYAGSDLDLVINTRIRDENPSKIYRPINLNQYLQTKDKLRIFFFVSFLSFTIREEKTFRGLDPDPTFSRWSGTDPALLTPNPKPCLQLTKKVLFLVDGLLRGGGDKEKTITTKFEGGYLSGQTTKKTFCGFPNEQLMLRKNGRGLDLVWTFRSGIIPSLSFYYYEWLAIIRFFSLSVLF